jgi:hypothetical protein
VASYFDDSITLTPPPSNGRSHILLDRKDFILRALDSSRELDDDAKKAGEEHLSSHSIDRTHSNGSPSTSLFSSDLVYSTSSTSQASSFSSTCISPISHSSSSSMPASAVCSARDGKIFGVCIAYSEVLQLQVRTIMGRFFPLKVISKMDQYLFSSSCVLCPVIAIAVVVKTGQCSRGSDSGGRAAQEPEPRLHEGQHSQTRAQLPGEGRDQDAVHPRDHNP